MDASIVSFQYDDLKFSLSLDDDNTVKRLKTEGTYIGEFCNGLLQRGLFDQIGLPSNADLSRIKLVTDDAITMNSGDEGGGSITILHHPDREKGSILWTDVMIRTLIKERLDREEEFASPISKRKLWAKIADVVNGKEYVVSPDDCDSKWRNLMATYRKNKERAAKHGEEAATWRYYTMMNEVLCKRVDLIKPRSSETLASKITRLTPQSSNSSNSPTNDKPSTSNETKEKERLKRQATEPPAWIVKYMEAQQKEDANMAKRWKEHTEREDRKIEAMYALIDVLKNKHV